MSEPDWIALHSRSGVVPDAAGGDEDAGDALDVAEQLRAILRLLTDARRMVAESWAQHAWVREDGGDNRGG